MRKTLLFAALSLPLAGAERTWSYPEAPSDATVDRYGSAHVPDPYRPLESLDAPATQAWVRAENALTFGFLAGLPQRPWFHAQLARLWDYPRFGIPFKEGANYFFTKNDGLQNQALLYVQPALDAPPRVLLDPNVLSKDGTVALASAAVSDDGQWLAYATASAGSDWNELRVRSVATAQDTADDLRWIKFSGASWTADNRGFFYSRFPEPKAGGDPKTFGELAHQRVCYHRLGDPQAADRVIYEIAAQPQWLLATEVTEDGRYALITVSRGDSNNNLLSVIDLGDPAHPRIDGPVRPLIDTWTEAVGVIGTHASVLFVQTDRHAPRRQIAATDLAAPGTPVWRTVVPEGSDTIENSALIGGRLVLQTMHDASSRLLIRSRDGREAPDVALPGIGTVGAISGRDDSPELFYSFTSFTAPSSIFRYDVARGSGAVLQAPPALFDAAQFETDEVFYRSKDGTRVPMFLTYRKGLRRNGRNPTLLYAYGGFNISMTPAYSVPVMVWLQLGGIYAQPSLRGGGEYGKVWHEAGTKERKQHVFDDFIAAAEWLFAKGYTQPQHLVISGGSNGGLLIGATLNQRPDLCRVAWPAVGVMDMLRFQKFTIGWAWEADYGSSDTPEGFAYLRAYSPLHNVKAGAHYPAVLITTADHDDRVDPAHSFKYTATMQAEAYNGAGALPVLVRIETRAGHGAGKPITKQIEEASDKLAFAAYFLGLSIPPQSAGRKPSDR